MEESIQCYPNKKKKIHRNLIKVLWDFFFFLKVKFFSSLEMSMEIHLPFSKKLPYKFLLVWCLQLQVRYFWENINISDIQISIHTFRVMYVHCSSHSGYTYNCKGCSSSLIQSFMFFWEEMVPLLGHSFGFRLLLWLACDVTEWWLPQCHPLAWSKWHFASQVSCAGLSLLLICVEKQQ